MHCDPGQPGGELCPPGKLVQMLVRTHVRILHDVFSFAVIPQNGPRYAVETLVVPAHDDFEHTRLAS
jgi:hypothetical protein